MESQVDSSFQVDGHKAILNKMNNKSKTNRKQINSGHTLTIKVNLNRCTALEQPVINYLVCVWGGGAEAREGGGA